MFVQVVKDEAGAVGCGFGGGAFAFHSNPTKDHFAKCLNRF